MTSRYRGALLFHIRLVGEELRLTSDHQLSRFLSLPAIPSSKDEFRLNGSHIDLFVFNGAPESLGENSV